MPVILADTSDAAAKAIVWIRQTAHRHDATAAAVTTAANRIKMTPKSTTFNS